MITTHGSCLKSDKIPHSHVLTTIPTHSKQAKVIESLLKYFNWTYIFVAYHDTSHEILGYEELRKCYWFCFSNEILIKEDFSNVRDSLKSLTKDERSNVFVLFGSNEMKKAVLEEGSLYRESFICCISNSW